MGVNNIKTNGITLFTLKSNFNEDITKDCGLLGKEIDANFLFLRNNDIYSGEIVDGNLILHRGNNLDDVVIEGLTAPCDIVNGNYDYNTDTLFIETTNNTLEITGFSKNQTINTLKPLIGDGSFNNPLRLSNLYKSPYLPTAKTLIDKTINQEIGDEYKRGEVNVLTREYKDNGGLLYNFNGVTQIQNKLNEINSIWRVPSNSDWYEMLNAIELCDKRDHNQNIVGEYGKFAGAFLKNDGTNWKDTTTVSYSYGFKATPCGFKINANDEDSNFGLVALFWSNSKLPSGDAWARQLEYNTSTVKLVSADKNYFISLRLVTDEIIEGDEIKILDDSYGTVKMPYVKLDENNEIIESGYRTWITSNVRHIIDDNSTNTQQPVTEIEYYLNKWNGNFWEKRKLLENDVLTIEDRENKEYKLLNNSLHKVTSVEDVVEEIDIHNYYTKDESSNLFQPKGDYALKNDLNNLVKKNDLNVYYTKNEIDDKNYLTGVPENYVTENELNQKGYLTGVPSNYVTTEQLNNKGFLTGIPSNYVTTEQLNNKGYLTGVPSNYVTTEQLNQKGYLTGVPSGYVTEVTINELKGTISALTEEITYLKKIISHYSSINIIDNKYDDDDIKGLVTSINAIECDTDEFTIENPYQYKDYTARIDLNKTKLGGVINMINN